MVAKMKSKKKVNGFTKLIKWVVIGAIAIFIYFGYILFAPNIFPKTDEKAFLCIPDSSTYNDVGKLLEKTVLGGRVMRQWRAAACASLG